MNSPPHITIVHSIPYPTAKTYRLRTEYLPATDAAWRANLQLRREDAHCNRERAEQIIEEMFTPAERVQWGIRIATNLFELK